MKIFCAVCTKEIELSKEEIQKYIALSKTGKVKPVKLLKLLDIYEGECEGGEEHAFSWNLEFLKQVEEMKSNFYGLNEKAVIERKEIEGLTIRIEDLKKKLEESEKQKIGLEKDQEDITINKIPEVINKFEAITGTKEFEDWK